MNEKKIQLRNDLLASINIENPGTANYTIPDHLAGRVKSLMSIKSDLEEVHRVFTELSVRILMNDQEEIVRTALWKCAIITYGKCFCDSQDGGQTKLEMKDCFAEDDYYRAVHQSIMDARHGYIAHRGANEFEETIAFFKVGAEHPEYTEYAMKSFRAANSNFKNLVDYLNVVEHLQEHVEEKTQKQFQKVNDHLRSNYSAERMEELRIK